jgi:uracil-DNA glycosylase
MSIERIFRVARLSDRRAGCCARRYARWASEKASATSQMRSSISSSSRVENDASIRRLAREIDHCRWWLDRELALIDSPLVVTLGASALRAVAGPSARLADMRGRPIALGVRTLLPTIHPAYLLRLPDPAAKEAETRAFANDLRQAAGLAHEGGQGMKASRSH